MCQGSAGGSYLLVKKERIGEEIGRAREGGTVIIGSCMEKDNSERCVPGSMCSEFMSLNAATRREGTMTAGS